jgi:Uma2 family endonuclease
MATSTVVPVRVPLADYLETVYRPDCDWIDGEVRERNMGEMPHASVQGFLSHFFRVNGKAWGIWALPEQRVQTSADHYRIADVCVVLRSAGFEPIVRTAPLLCVEILPRDDRMSEIQERVDDYFGMGVGAVWVIDPRRRRAYLSLPGGAMLPQETTLTVPGTAIEVLASEMFLELDEMEGKLS